LAFPSLYEGFGLPILEAMACGLPTVIADSSSLPEVGGSAAVLLSSTDEEAWSEALLTLLGNEQERENMVEAGFVQVRRFSWRKAAQELLQVYEALLQ
jgi:glycosyltransferase involved in cell wall biosynthesis